ncbi:MAG: membrane dipeptidase [Ruminococcaceae bacterium]|nr:membrane dipeptidase [Oscillospiraceae bacterium]
MEKTGYHVIDGHCDTLYELWKQGGELRQNKLDISLESLSLHTSYVQFFAVWLDDATKTAKQDALAMIEVFERELAKNKDILLPVRDAADFELVNKQGKIGGMLTIENGRALEGSLDNLQLFYDLGVKALTLTWNEDNDLSGGIFGENRGLTEFGRDVIGKMNRLGMMVDVSHLSVQGFWDALAISKAPIMASHSCALSVAAHRRNLSDEQIRALAEQGGMHGLNLYPAFLKEEAGAGISDMVSHIQHITAVGGEDSVGLGSDFDGFSGDRPIGLCGPEDYSHLFDALHKAGYSDDAIEKISHGNWLRYVKDVLK